VPAKIDKSALVQGTEQMPFFKMITRQASASDLAMFWFGIFFAIISAA